MVGKRDFLNTSAPHYLLIKDFVSWLTMGRQDKNDLIIIDISNPRNVEETVKDNDLKLVEAVTKLLDASGTSGEAS